MKVSSILVAGATLVAVVAALRHGRPEPLETDPGPGVIVRSGAGSAARAALPDGVSGATPTAPGIARHPTPDAGADPSVAAGRMILPGGSFLLTVVTLVSPEGNHLTEAAMDILKLQPAEAEAIEALLARAVDEARAHRRSRQAVQRRANGRIEIEDKEEEWADFIKVETARLSEALDAESASALQAVGVRQLLTAPPMMGLVGAEPIPGSPAMMAVQVRNGALTLHQQMSRAALETLLAP